MKHTSPTTTTNRIRSPLIPRLLSVGHRCSPTHAPMAKETIVYAIRYICPWSDWSTDKTSRLELRQFLTFCRQESGRACAAMAAYDMNHATARNRTRRRFSFAPISCTSKNILRHVLTGRERLPNYRPEDGTIGGANGDDGTRPAYNSTGWGSAKSSSGPLSGPS